MDNEKSLERLKALTVKNEVISNEHKFIKINKIQLSNFRFFVNDEKHNTFELNGHNMLLYGENGSGKSSLFKAFELLSNIGKQSVSKVFDENRNIFNREEEDNFSFVKFNFNNDTELEINDGQTQKNSVDFIKNISLVRPMLDYRELLKVVNIKEENLYPFFESILDEYPVSEDKVLRTLREEKDDTYFTKFEKILKEELFDSINSILAQFEQDFTIKEIDFNSGFHTIYLKIEYFNKEIPKYQRFLNEARLSALAISVYFAVIKKQFSVLSGNSLKILVLDDLLISLDMSNRRNLLTILKNEFSDFQIFMFTHDKTFFEMAKQEFNYVQKGKWKYFEMYVDDKGDFEKPFILPHRDYFAKAEYFFLEHDYPTCANYLRKEAERLLKSLVCHHRDLSCSETKNLQILIDKTKIKGSLVEKENIVERVRDLVGYEDFQKFIDFDMSKLQETEDKKTIGIIRVELKKFKDFSNKEIAGLEETLIMLEKFKTLILNPQSHDDNKVPLYKKELEEAIKNIRELRDKI